VLILSRKKGQSILIGNDIEIVISAIEGDQVKIGIQAPKDVNILRKEIYETIQSSNLNASRVKVSPDTLRNMSNFKKK
jgi:carbon storage regulator